ncbi:MAG: 6-phosphogluconolactonase [Bacteroidetes bacterium]|nr:6-phosphogluconolactonase [Bacteroidota bacterium]MBU1373488.1 6-phosphogluconolactonase [Bacteroidota bacterium]MBU1485246.1 6-phosphogluconolactonase [Bacteroidota bacterium]MBU1761840.1 6-phosphogluconolactonase [Bacteroidota bacterium]MBU2045432.1 6-phosphogluconolactonase [Bacteroidota bacterium]
MKLNVFNSPDLVIKNLANFFVKLANEAIHDHQYFFVALSGGNSPKKLHQLLASDEYKNQVDWTKVLFFFSDERYVPQDHPDSNYLMAKETLLDPLNIPEEQVCKIDTSLDPASAAQDYERCICKHFKEQPIFDLILLGLGDDAHTASIFPQTSLVWIDEELVKEVYLKDKQVYRISFTAPLINQAKNVAFLTFGTNKANAIKAVLEGERNVAQYPAQLIKPANGTLSWFVDDDAVSLLDKK